MIPTGTMLELVSSFCVLLCINETTEETLFGCLLLNISMVCLFVI